MLAPQHHQLFRCPVELRQLKQWILWKYEDVGSKKPTKVPYSIRGDLASVSNPNTWATFEECVNSYMFGGYDGIGFVFTDNDPFAVIDLDDTEGNQEDQQRQIKIFGEFDSYSEVSPSGKGLHIIIKGAIPQGRKRAHIEVYSSGRYITMTGNVYSDKPIADKHELLNMLFKQMGGPPIVSNYTGDEKEVESDAEIIEKASNATNGDKFRLLHNGEWQNIYSSQSEADFAYIDIIAFYTQNRNQIARLFRSSGLGKRAKANRKDYLEWMINKSFDRLLPKIDFDGFRIALEEKLATGSVNGKPAPFEGVNVGSSPSPVANGPVAQRLEPVAHNGSVVGSNPTGTTNASPTLSTSPETRREAATSNDAGSRASTIIPPPGLLGEIAHFIYEAAPRPVPEIALAAAIGLMAGVCGRAYNISGTGLNQYVLLIAMTGAGKEAMASGIDKLINAVTMSVPVAPEFVGPTKIQSGQALYKHLSNQSQCFVSIIGEFGKRLEIMSSKTANSAEKNLLTEFLDLYNKSGNGQFARQSIYADQAKNTATISSPAFSILGESTPETLYGSLNEDMISDGLLPRFMLIEYNGPRPALNEHHVNVQPSLVLVEKLAALMANAKTVMANRKVTNIDRTEGAAKLLAQFDKLADSKINTTDKEAIRQLWNRAHIKVLKLSGLIAVGVNYIQPVITEEYVLWAKQMVEFDIKALSMKFESGEVGRSSEEGQQIKDIKRLIVKYATEDCPKNADKQMHSLKIIASSFISARLYSMASFRKDVKVSQKVAVDRAIKIMLEYGWLINIPEAKALKWYSTTAKLYQIGPMVELMKE
jgi:hypothetical protein